MLEDYFHVAAFHKIIHHGKWYRFETRFEQNTLNTLHLLIGSILRPPSLFLVGLQTANPRSFKKC